MRDTVTYFWRVVLDCLVRFQGLSIAEATARIRDFRLQLNSQPQDIDADIIFHEDQFALAARLARSEQLAPTLEQRIAYERILSDRMHEAAALGSLKELLTLEMSKFAAEG